MSVQVKGSGTIGGLDEGLVVSGIVTSSTQINVGSNIKIGSAGVVTATSFVGSGSNLTGITQTTINNNADNRVITGSGTANTLNAESTLTWSGVLLDLFQNTTAETGLKIRNSEGSCLIRTNDDKTFVDTDELIIRNEASTERLRIDSSGRLLIGTNTSRGVGDVTAKIQLEGNGFAASSLSLISNAGASAGNTPHLTLGKSRGSSTGSNTIVASGDALGQIQFAGADGTDCNTVAASIIGRVDGTPGSNDMPGLLTFNTTADGAAVPTERLRIKSDGDVSIADGNLIVANGHGIDFSATANATAGQYNSINPTTDSEILHDYEFGSFTPHIRTQGGTSNATYAQKGGYYTKIGRQVYCTFFMNWSNASNHSGYIYFVGLPYFSGSNTSSHLMYGIGTVQLNNFTISGNGGAVLHMGANTSGTNLASNNSGGNSINEGHTNNGYIMANVTYIANY